MDCALVFLPRDIWSFYLIHRHQNFYLFIFQKEGASIGDVVDLIKEKLKMYYGC